MRSQIQFDRIAAAIDYLQKNFQEQPNLDDVAKYIHLSPTHFQKIFTEWVGTSPKKFLQYISVEHAKSILKQSRDSTIFDATFETGLSSTSRLHDLFIQIEGMTPAEYKSGGKNLTIHYDFAETIFGKVIIASTTKGICLMTFSEDENEALQQLKAKFPNAEYLKKTDEMQKSALAIFDQKQSEYHVNPLSKVKLHLKGTDFQLKVWESLLKIPMGQLSTYGELANAIGNAKASRAVGTAIGSNPVAFLIPCHRVIQSTGTFGGYHWGTTRKIAMIGWEGIQTDATLNYE